MMMKLFVGGGNCENLAAYRKHQENVQKFSYVLLALACVTFLLANLAVPRLLAPGQQLDFLQGFYTGVGFGLIGVSIVVAFNTRRLLRDEARLKAAFVKATDERNRAISAAALQATALTMLILLYLALFVLGLFYPVLFWFCFACVMAAVVILLCFVAYYHHKM